MKAIHFAPLQGYTDDVYRRVHHAIYGGVTCYYSPFLRLESGRVRNKDQRDVRPTFNENVPFVPQIIAANLEEFQTLTNYLAQLGYRHIDLNMGCPFPLQTRHGRGAGILAQRDKLKDIFTAIAQQSHLNFSIKLRLGQNDFSESLQLLPLINDCPLRHVTLHPRLGIQQYKGTADRDAFARFAQECQQPLIYNGDLRTPNDVEQLVRDFPELAGIMIGRGLLARPSLAQELQNGEWTHPQRIARLRQLHDQLYAHYAANIASEAQLLAKLRTIWDYAEEEIGRKVFKQLHKAGSLRNYLRALEELS